MIVENSFHLKPSDSERFWSKVNRVDSSCWDWLGGHYGNGYGKFSFGTAQMGAHRAVLLISGVALGKDQEVDHVCRNRMCVRPDHLRVVPKGFNAREGGHRTGERIKSLTHCRPAGHPLVPGNIYLDKRGNRSCRRCSIDRSMLRYRLRGKK